MAINKLSALTREVVETARKSFVIGSLQVRHMAPKNWYHKALEITPGPRHRGHIYAARQRHSSYVMHARANERVTLAI